MLTTNLLALLPLLPLALGLADRSAHDRSRSRARQLFGKHAGVEQSLVKRESFTGRATFYDVGLGACGGYNVASDYIVALNTPQYGNSYPSPNCYKSITISYGGKTATAQIADQCPGCGYGDLDFSRGLFDHFASEDLGTFQMTWWFNDGSNDPAPAPSTSTYEAPTSTYTPPTSTYTPPTTTSETPTSTYVPPSTTSTSTSSSTSTSTSTSTTVSTTIISSSASLNVTSSAFSSVSANATTTSTGIADFITTSSGPSATASVDGSSIPLADASLGNLVMINQAVAYLGHIVVVGAGGK